MAKLLKITPTPINCETTLAQIEATRKAIYDRRQGKPFEIDISEIIHQMREERDRQCKRKYLLLNDCFCAILDFVEWQ